MSQPRARVIVADPPWTYRDGLEMSDVKRSSRSQYKTMTVDEIIALGGFGTVAGYASLSDAFLFLWVTNPFLLDGSGARVCRGWGFEPRQLITWVKGRLVGHQAVDADPKADDMTARLVLQIGMGHITRGATEHMILATRGQVSDRVLAKNVPNVFIAPRTKHSRKPAEAYALIESLAPGPYVELFAREQRAGWSTWGDEVAA